jgi:phosphoribosyl 1,2-cyclic phosphodiesterase
MVEIVFLGTGGGRFNLISQTRKTGGFRINGSLKIHIDPGPGALANSHFYGQEPRAWDLLIVTHNHIDHVNDAGLMIEAVSKWNEKHGFLIASKSVIEGDEKGDKGVAAYHLGKLEKHEIAVPGKQIKLRIRGKSISILPTKVKHEDKTGFGFVLEMDGLLIGYTSDTEYFAGISEQYAGCDVLIANCLKPSEDGIPGHLYSDSTAKLFSEAAPKLGIISHLGMSMLKANPEKEAKKIGMLSGIKTVAAVDGMRLNLAKEHV